MDIKEIIKEENLAYRKSSLLTDKVFNFCPGCGHGTTVRMVAEVIEEMGIQSETIGVGSVGCSVLIYDFLNCDMTGAAHGRAAAVATGIIVPAASSVTCMACVSAASGAASASHFATTGWFFAFRNALSSSMFFASSSVATLSTMSAGMNCFLKSMPKWPLPHSGNIFWVQSNVDGARG